MPNQLKTMTAPRAVVEKDGEPIGLIRNIRVQETLSRGSVRGLGTIYEVERPVMTFQGTWNCDVFLIDLVKSGIPGLDKRGVTDTEIYEQTQVLLEQPVDIVIQKKEAETIDENGNVTSVNPKGFATLRDCYLDSMSFDISEGSVSTLNQSGVYTKSIIVPNS